jgi:hypothetical protein
MVRAVLLVVFLERAAQADLMALMALNNLVLLVALMAVAVALLGMVLAVEILQDQVLGALFVSFGLATSARSQAQQQEICKEISWRLLQQQITHQKIM